jgi:hypothetical protein
MEADRFSGPNPKQGRGAKRDACASGEHRPESHWEPGGPIRPTEGRVIFRRGGVALLCRWRRHRHAEARLATTQNHPGQMAQSGRKML